MIALNYEVIHELLRTFGFLHLLFCRIEPNVRVLRRFFLSLWELLIARNISSCFPINRLICVWCLGLRWVYISMLYLKLLIVKSHRRGCSFIFTLSVVLQQNTLDLLTAKVLIIQFWSYFLVLQINFHCFGLNILSRISSQTDMLIFPFLRSVFQCGNFALYDLFISFKSQFPRLCNLHHLVRVCCHQILVSNGNAHRSVNYLVSLISREIEVLRPQ